MIGIAKAYVTRVGEGPFPTEIEGSDQERVRELGGEFGTVTGRERRCGWLDLVALRYAVRLNGITSLALTKLDVLSHFAELPVCVAYRLRDGSETYEFPAHQSDFHHCRPVYETLPGWQEPLTDELPKAARGYVAFVEQALGVEISLVGTGAGARERRRAALESGAALDRPRLRAEREGAVRITQSTSALLTQRRATIGIERRRCTPQPDRHRR